MTAKVVPTSLLVPCAMLAMSIAHAEAPMNVDDAGTLNKGGMKVEGVWHKDENVTGGALLFGFSPIETLELEIGALHDNNVTDSPNATMRGGGLGAKWVPIQNETGWSLGARFDYGHTRVEGKVEHEYALTGLASYRFDNHQVLHLNAGAVHVEASEGRENLHTWGIGYDFPLREGLQLTAEIFGEAESGPDKALGLRYEIFDGFKVSASVGYGNDRGFGQAGFAWEF